MVIDDVVPVGYAMHGNNTYAQILAGHCDGKICRFSQFLIGTYWTCRSPLQASLLPTSQDVNIIWPQLLAKALSLGSRAPRSTWVPIERVRAKPRNG